MRSVEIKTTIQRLLVDISKQIAVVSVSCSLILVLGEKNFLRHQIESFFDFHTGIATDF